MITVAGAHAEGELNEVITGGVLDVPGKTMFERMRWLETEGDDLRKFLLNEPRGKVNQCHRLPAERYLAEQLSAARERPAAFTKESPTRDSGAQLWSVSGW